MARNHVHNPSRRRLPLLEVAAPKKMTTGSKSQLRANELLSKPLRFIPAAEFERLEGDDGPEAVALELIESLSRPVSPPEPKGRSKLLLNADDCSSRYEWNSDAPLLTFEHEQLLFRALNLMLFRAERLRSRLSPSAPSRKAMNEIDRLLRQAEEIRSQLVKSNMRLVGSIARKFSSQNCDVDDLSSDGCMILLGAIDRFDYSRGFRFSTYATHSIQRHFYRIWKQRQRRKERFPNLGAEMLAAVASNETEESICDDPQAVVHRLMKRAEATLDEREQQILISRFGLAASDGQSRTLREIAADLGLSKERVRQLQLTALKKLREFLDPEQELVYCDSLALAAGP